MIFDWTIICNFAYSSFICQVVEKYGFWVLYNIYWRTGMLDTTCFCCKKTKQTKQRYFQRKTFVYNCVQYTLGLYTIHAQCSRFEIAVVQGARPICRSVRHHIWICILLTPPHGSFMVREISISNIFHFIWSHGWISELLTSEMPTGRQFWGGQLWVSPSSELPTLNSLFLSHTDMTPNWS